MKTKVSMTKGRIDFICPFCKKQASAGYAEMSNGMDGFAVMHTEPYCKEFLEQEPDEYLHSVNSHLNLNN